MKAARWEPLSNDSRVGLNNGCHAEMLNIPIISNRPHHDEMSLRKLS